MFEFGRDLRKLFEKARESDDLGWLELIGADLVESEARAQATLAGRVSNPRPFDAWMRASTLFREHARRTGSRTSLDRAASTASDAMRAAVQTDQKAAAGLEAVEIHLLAFDLYGGAERLTVAASDLQGLAPERSATRVWAASAHARLNARRARTSGQIEIMARAAALIEATLTAARHLPAIQADELRLERASLLLDVGVEHRDARSLDHAGRELRDLVERAPADQRPVTRARALAMAGAGLRALSALADDADGALNGRALFEAAAEQFTPDHSPLDWVGVQLAQGEQASLATLAQCETLSREPGLILGALTRERRVAVETALAQVMGDAKALAALEETVKGRLSLEGLTAVDWAAEQIGLARLAVARARLAGREPTAVGMVLAESALTAREQGAETLARLADAALVELTPA